MSDIFKTRRDFLKNTLLGASATWTLPAFVERTFAEMNYDAKQKSTQVTTGKDSTILVVLQLAGGNDGLNTLVPYTNDLYFKARPKIHKKPTEVIPLSDTMGLNKAMPWLAESFKEGHLGIVQGVGYPNPNRSHFVSTSIWETADPQNHSSTGWLGRYFDSACMGSDPTVGISFNKALPESFGAKKHPGICVSSPELYRWINGNDSQTAESLFAELNRPDKESATSGASIAMPAGGKVGGKKGESNLDFLERVALDAQVSSSKILELAAKYKTKVAYEGTPIARSLSLVSRMIAGGMTTRVYYVSHGGFDTHNGQLNTHERLLSQLDNALKSFMLDLREQGNADRVVVMTFSEFGRRVAENGSAGTDHGQGSCLFVVGDSVKAGFHGVAPSLADLVDGDLKFTTDFRSVYSTVLEKWMKVPSSPILGGKYAPLSFL